MSKRSSGGFLGTGVFGFFGTTIKCESTDTSLYCNIMKLFNLLIVFMVICYILYLAYGFINPFISKRVRSSG